MPPMKSRLAVVLLALACALSGCFPGPEKLGELTRTSMQQHFRRDPQFKDSGAEIVQVRVTGGGDKRFDAMASVRHAGKTHEVPITILLDGINLEWLADPAAFSFLVPSKPADVPQIPRPEREPARR